MPQKESRHYGDTIKGIMQPDGSADQLRIGALPADLRRTLIQARTSLGWSQRELAHRTGISQRRISEIETGNVVPRYDTVLEIARTLDLDLIPVPRVLVPAVQALIRGHASGPEEEQPLYAARREDGDGN